MKIVLPFVSNTVLNFIIGLLLARFLGPAEYGRMALAIGAAAVLQTIVFDWLRLAGTRFYSERARTEWPALRSTLDVCFAVLIVALSLGTILFMLVGVDVPLSNGLVGLAVGACVANGLFDYHTALVRARFQDGVYARIIIGKNILSLGLTVGGAWWFGSAIMALLGLCLSMTGSLLAARRSIGDPRRGPRLIERAVITQALAYGLPIVLANMAYQAIPLIDRAVIAARFGFAESGQFSLAYDLGIRIVAAIGSTLDVLLFQIAVRADEAEGAAHADRQIARNMAVVLALLAPTCVGCWLVLPSFEHLVVPPDFRGPFAHFLGLMLPAFFCQGMINYAVHPVFQIRKNTKPLIVVAGLTALTNIGLILAAPAGADASPYGLALSGAMGVGLMTLILLACRAGAAWPSARDLGITVLASGAMVLVLLPLRGLPPGAATLALQVALGALAYLGCVLACDLAGLRGLMLQQLRARGLFTEAGYAAGGERPRIASSRAP